MREFLWLRNKKPRGVFTVNFTFSFFIYLFFLLLLLLLSARIGDRQESHIYVCNTQLAVAACVGKKKKSESFLYQHYHYTYTVVSAGIARGGVRDLFFFSLPQIVTSKCVSGSECDTCLHTLTRADDVSI